MISDEETREDQRREQARNEQREKERVAQELKDRQEKELADFKTLLENAERWHKADNLRNYIAIVQKIANNGNPITEDLKNWLEWANKKADWYDPFKAINDDLLADVDMVTLTFKRAKKKYNNW